MGGNPAENHPCGFKWAIEARKTRNAKIVAVDPRFTRTAAVADLYSPIRAGTDIAYLLGIIRYAIENKRYHEDYVKLHTNAAVHHRREVRLQRRALLGLRGREERVRQDGLGLRGGPEDEGLRRRSDAREPALRLPAPEEARRALHARDGRADLRRTEGDVPEGGRDRHVDRHRPIASARSCTRSAGRSTRRASRSSAPAAMLQLLLGNVGRPGGGVNALRGHSNIQGATDMAGNTEILPGYLKTPSALHQTLKQYLDTNTPTTLNKQAWASMNYWVNYPKFMVSLLKAAGARTRRRRTTSATRGCRRSTATTRGCTSSTTCTAAARARRRQGARARRADHVRHEPGRHRAEHAEDDRGALEAEVARRGRERRDRDRDVLEGAEGIRRRPTRRRSRPRSSCCPPPTFAEKDGTLHELGALAAVEVEGARSPGQAKADQEILARIFLAVRDLYKKEGGALPEQVLNVSWSYTNPAAPDLGEVLKEINGKALADIPIRRTRRRSSRPPASSSTDSASCRTTARRCAATGSTPASTPRPATTRSGATTPTRRARHVPQLGVLVARESPHHVQPRVRRQGRQAVGSDARRHRVERREVGRRRPRHQARSASPASSARSS